MAGTLVSIAFLVLLFLFVSWGKHKRHRKPEKQWEGPDSYEQPKSVEEFSQNENKYRKPGAGGGSGSM